MDISALFHIVVALVLLLQLYGRKKIPCKRLRPMVVVAFVVMSFGAAVAMLAPIF